MTNDEVNFRVLVCGSRTWGVVPDVPPIELPLYQKIAAQERIIIRTLLDGLLVAVNRYEGKLTVIEGKAPGADDCAHLWATGHPEVEHLCFPADWDRYGKAAGPIRNKQMLDEGKPDKVYAFSNDINVSRGTKNMCEQASNAGLLVYLTGRYNPTQGKLL